MTRRAGRKKGQVVNKRCCCTFLLLRVKPRVCGGRGVGMESETGIA